MSKKFLFLMLSLFMLEGAVFETNAQSSQLPLGVKKIDDKPTHPGYPKKPIEIPVVWQDGYELEIEAPHAEYVLNIVSGTTVAYSVVVPANVSVVYLPATLTGTFELQLYDGGEYYFYSEIEL